MTETIESLTSIGAILSITISSIGSVVGTVIAGMATVGAWKKSYTAGKKPSFMLVTFASAPIAQTIYGMILMHTINTAPQSVYPLTKLMAGLLGGVSIGASAWGVGLAGAAACEALGEIEQGVGNYLMIIGIIETVAILVMVFIITLLR